MLLFSCLQCVFYTFFYSSSQKPAFRLLLKQRKRIICVDFLEHINNELSLLNDATSGYFYQREHHERRTSWRHWETRQCMKQSFCSLWFFDTIRLFDHPKQCRTKCALNTDPPGPFDVASRSFRSEIKVFEDLEYIVLQSHQSLLDESVLHDDLRHPQSQQSACEPIVPSARIASMTMSFST